MEIACPCHARSCYHANTVTPPQAASQLAAFPRRAVHWELNKTRGSPPNAPACSVSFTRLEDPPSLPNKASNPSTLGVGLRYRAPPLLYSVARFKSLPCAPGTGRERGPERGRRQPREGPMQSTIKKGTGGHRNGRRKPPPQPSNADAQLATRDLDPSAHGLLLVNRTPQNSSICDLASSKGRRCGKKLINGHLENRLAKSSRVSLGDQQAVMCGWSDHKLTTCPLTKN